MTTASDQAAEEAHSKAFASQEEQVENIRRANASRGWGFTEDEFHAISLRYPSQYHTSPHVLVPYLDTVQQTFEELWDVIDGTYPSTSRDPLLATDAEHLRYAKGISSVPAHRLRWERISLRKLPEPSVRPNAAHAGVLAAFGHHRALAYNYYAMQLGSPRLVIRGFEALPIEGDPSWGFSPTIEVVRNAEGLCPHLGIESVCGPDIWRSSSAHPMIEVIMQ